MRTGKSAALAIVAALTLGSAASATEPDGRVAFRYVWPDKADGAPETPPRLRLSVTAFVNLAESRLRATLPVGIQLTVRAEGRAATPWPEDGLAIGELAAGETIVVDLDVAKAPRGAGVVAFVLQGLADGKVVHEGVGVPVGGPGLGPTLRSGAAEFPAAREDPAP
jgi:hypothetical protein